MPEDIRRQLRYGKVEAPITVPERYQVQASAHEKTPEIQQQFRPGDQVTVMSGDLAGMCGIVSKTKKHTVRLNIHFLGQQLDIEVEAGDVKKLG